MRTCIRDRVVDEIAREIRIISVTVKRELQNPRARHLKLITERCHARSNDAQILGDEWQVPEFARNRSEKIGPWSWHPFAGLSSLHPGRDVPRGLECSEVIETNDVDVTQQTSDPVDAPSVASRTKRVPVVNRITPKLSFRTEVIGRNSSDETWPPPLIQQEELRVGPHVGRIR